MKFSIIYQSVVWSAWCVGSLCGRSWRSTLGWLRAQEDATYFLGRGGSKWIHLTESRGAEKLSLGNADTFSWLTLLAVASSSLYTSHRTPYFKRMYVSRSRTTPILQPHSYSCAYLTNLGQNTMWRGRGFLPVVLILTIVDAVGTGSNMTGINHFGKPQARTQNFKTVKIVPETSPGVVRRMSPENHRHCCRELHCTTLIQAGWWFTYRKQTEQQRATLSVSLTQRNPCWPWTHQCEQAWCNHQSATWEREYDLWRHRLNQWAAWMPESTYLA